MVVFFSFNVSYLYIIFSSAGSTIKIIFYYKYSNVKYNETTKSINTRVYVNIKRRGFNFEIKKKPLETNILNIIAYQNPWKNFAGL